jgi:hypothetical protein
MIVCLPVGAHVEALDCLSWRLSSTGWLGGVYAPNVHHRQAVYTGETVDQRLRKRLYQLHCSTEG